MAITSDKVRNASDHLDTVTKALLVTWFRESDDYRANPLVYSADIVSRLDAAEGTITARIINAVVKEIDKLGVGEVEIRGDRDAVWWNQHTERQALLRTAFLTLYGDLVDIAENGGDLNAVIPDRGLYGDAAVGQREFIGIGGLAAKYTGVCCGLYPSCSCNVTIYRQKSYP